MIPIKPTITLLECLAQDTSTLKIADLELHALTEEHPDMTESEFNRLKNSIEELGQLEPVLIYDDKIVDGRHRYWALESLGIEDILVREIPSTTPIGTVKEIVFSTEVRRHQTATQKAIKAWMYIQTHGATYREAEAKFMTSRTMISACSYIAKVKGTDILDMLYKGQAVAIGTRKSSALRTVKNFIQDEEDMTREARFSKEVHMSFDKAKEEAKPYMDSLGREPLEVIEYVAKGAYRLLKDRESKPGNNVTKL